MDKVVGTMKVDLVKTEYPYTNKKGVEVMGYNYAFRYNEGRLGKDGASIYE